MNNKICYMEDFFGGFFCYSIDKDYFLSQDTHPYICFEGTKEKVEEYLHIKLKEKDILEKYVKTKNGLEFNIIDYGY